MQHISHNNVRQVAHLPQRDRVSP